MSRRSRRPSNSAGEAFSNAATLFRNAAPLFRVIPKVQTQDCVMVDGVPWSRCRMYYVVFVGRAMHSICRPLRDSSWQVSKSTPTSVDYPLTRRRVSGSSKVKKMLEPCETRQLGHAERSCDGNRAESTVVPPRQVVHVLICSSNLR